MTACTLNYEYFLVVYLLPFCEHVKIIILCKIIITFFFGNFFMSKLSASTPNNTVYPIYSELLG